MRQLKFRLILNGEIVGWERHVKVDGFIEIQHSRDGELWVETDESWDYDLGMSVHNFIPHSSKDQWTEFVDKDKKEIYDKDVLKNHQAGENTVFWYEDGSWCMENYHAGALLLANYAGVSKIISTPYK